MPVMSGPSLKIRISCLCPRAEKELFKNMSGDRLHSLSDEE